MTRRVAKESLYDIGEQYCVGAAVTVEEYGCSIRDACGGLAGNPRLPPVLEYSLVVPPLTLLLPCEQFRATRRAREQPTQQVNSLTHSNQPTSQPTQILSLPKPGQSQSFRYQHRHSCRKLPSFRPKLRFESALKSPSTLPV